jgi:hypothetical protein
VTPAWSPRSKAPSPCVYFCFEPLVALLLPWSLFLNHRLQCIVCASCGKEVARVADKVRSFSSYRTFIPRICDQCGAPLDQ